MSRTAVTINVTNCGVICFVSASVTNKEIEETSTSRLGPHSLQIDTLHISNFR